MSAQADWSIGFRGHDCRGWSNWKKPWRGAALCLAGPMTHGGFERGWCLGPLGRQQPEQALVEVGLRPGTPADLPGPEQTGETVA